MTEKDTNTRYTTALNGQRGSITNRIRGSQWMERSKNMQYGISYGLFSSLVFFLLLMRSSRQGVRVGTASRLREMPAVTPGRKLLANGWG